jgi:polyribonucleotide nucleotidyltransferase
MFPQTPFTSSIDFHGQQLILQTGLLAKQATASVVATLGETVVMASVVVGPNRGTDYFPLQVIYEERLYASGKIKGSRFIKREGRPTDQAVLTSRMIDRSLRSLFNDDIRNDIQCIVTVVSVDEINSPDTLSVIAASSAMSLCGFNKNFKGPISSVRVGAKKQSIKKRMIDNLLKDVTSATSYSQVLDKIDTVCQVFDLHIESDKLEFKRLFDFMKTKGEDWVEKLKNCYKTNIRMSQDEIVSKLGNVEKTIVNPSYDILKELDLNLVVSGDGVNIMMIEAGANIVDEGLIGECIDTAHIELAKLNNFQNEFIKKVLSKKEIDVIELEKVTPDEIYIEYWRNFKTELEKIMYFKGTKKIKENALKNYQLEHLSNFDFLQRVIKIANLDTHEKRLDLVLKFNTDVVTLRTTGGDLKFNTKITSKQILLLNKNNTDYNLIEKQLQRSAYIVIGEIMKHNILENNKRVDGRKLDETRNITCMVGFLPRTHGSSLFTRGETQVLNVLTIGTKRDAQVLDGMEDFEEVNKRYIHHYNFPQYCVGETGRYSGPGRREIGHGSLAEKALEPVLPVFEEFPYTMRLVSECLESNGSSSMASTCASCLSLLNGGVPLTDLVAGVAMGLVIDTQTNNFKVLTDIQGLEDYHGDMDFKVTGTKSGITALQLDNKVSGLTPNILKIALNKALQARLHILGIMKETIAIPNKDLSPYAPRVAILTVPFDKIGDVIGPSGKIIKSIISRTDTEIEIADDTGQTFVYGRDSKKVKEAVNIIESLIKEYKVGDIVKGTVFRIEDFGAFIKIENGSKEAMIHVSELDNKRTEKVEDVVKIGDIVSAKIIEIKHNGQLGASIKSLLPKIEKNERVESRKKPLSRKLLTEDPDYDPDIEISVE